MHILPLPLNHIICEYLFSNIKIFVRMTCGVDKHKHEYIHN